MTQSAVAATIESIRAILARPTDGWTVVVCPDDGLHIRTYRRYAPVLMPQGAMLSNGTVVRTDGSMVSFIGASDELEVPDGVQFDVEFAGWGTDVMSDAKAITTWRDRAARSR